jgi:hypothetical protein
MLLFVNSEWYNELPATEVKKAAAAAKAWLENLVAQGKMKSGHGLARSGARVTGGAGRVVSDGPYAESKEAIGGYIIVEADSMEEAIEIAKSNPITAYGTTTEVRQVSSECPLDRRVRELEQELTTA